MESVVALFREPAAAKTALEALEARGFARDHLGFTMLDTVKELELAQQTGISPEEGAPAGSSGVLKGIWLGVLGGLGITVPIWLLLLIIPATRVYQVGGLYGILFGVIGGAFLGLAFGALTGSDHGDYVRLMRQFGMPAAVAERYWDGMKRGLVLVVARNQQGHKADEALQLMFKNGAMRLEDVSGGGQLSSERRTQAH